jgi:hypothetical protein
MIALVLVNGSFAVLFAFAGMLIGKMHAAMWRSSNLVSESAFTFSVLTGASFALIAFVVGLSFAACDEYQYYGRGMRSFREFRGNLLRQSLARRLLRHESMLLWCGIAILAFGFIVSLGLLAKGIIFVFDLRDPFVRSRWREFGGCYGLALFFLGLTLWLRKI